MIRVFGLLVLFLVSSLSFSQGLVIGSWNIERLGHGNNKNYEALGLIGDHFDFIAVQEAMTLEGLQLFKDSLEEVSNESWDMIYSHRIGRGSYKEKYAFIWRESKVQYDTGAVVYLDNEDLFAREPYSAQFIDKTTDTTFVAATVHVLFGQSVGDRLPEIRELANYWTWLHEIYDDQPVLLLGDFNLSPNHAVWDVLYAENVKPLIVDGATTISSIDGRYANLYDNIFISNGSSLNVNQTGILKFPELLNWTHEDSRRHISDHVPVFLTTHNAVLQSQSITAQPEATDIQSLQEQRVDSIIGNRNSNIYHRPDCPSYNRVAEHNRRYFNTIDEAESAGYRIAGNC